MFLEIYETSVIAYNITQRYFHQGCGPEEKKALQSLAQKIVNERKLESDINMITKLQQMVLEGNGNLPEHRLRTYLENYPRPKNQTTSLIYVKDLRLLFDDATIRSLSFNLPHGWEYSAPSSSQTENPRWWEKNYQNLITMNNGNLVYYFFRYN